MRFINVNGLILNADAVRTAEKRTNTKGGVFLIYFKNGDNLTVGCDEDGVSEIDHLLRLLNGAWA